ncbi:MAG TPA: hypothetical protein VGF55_04670 [Gemmataceae bacterium]|jgi:hypothetical protein
MEKYGAKHRWSRLTEFPAGITRPTKVRLYRRAEHYLLNWWDPGEKKNLSERVDGDLLSALVRAREIDGRVSSVRTAGAGRSKRLRHADLVGQFLADLARRADAGEIVPNTVTRYRNALAHYLDYCGQPEVAKAFPFAATVSRDFRLGLSSYLTARPVTGNGRPGAPAHPMRGQPFVLDTVRALYEWASDPDRGGLLPHGFRNPFLRTGGRRPVLRGDPLAAPDVTVPMAVALIRACDCFQLRLFAPLALFGLRAAEPCFLLSEDLSDGWLLVPCRPELGVTTKGRRDKRFPLLADLADFWALLRGGGPRLLLYRRRGLDETAARAGLGDAARANLVEDFRRRCAKAGTAAERLRVRDRLFREAGGLRYNDIDAEFRRLADRLGWPKAATLKDLRHLFATAMNNAAMPEGYRRYLLGHAPGTAAAVAYTHLDDLRAHYERAVRHGLADVVAAIRERTAELTEAVDARSTGPTAVFQAAKASAELPAGNGTDLGHSPAV